MNANQALAGFAALSQDTRLAIVRLLVRAGPEGVPARTSRRTMASRVSCERAAKPASAWFAFIVQ